MQSALGTQLDMSTAYHPQADGQSKRTIQQSKTCFEHGIDFGKGEGSDTYHWFEFSSYNSITSASVKANTIRGTYGRSIVPNPDNARYKLQGDLGKGVMRKDKAKALWIPVG
ncbi:reverse transcriptase domain-containing protein [Tanacetum coccineum]